MIHDFRQIIINSGVIGRAFAVDRRQWDRLVTGPCRLLFGDAESYCFREAVSFAIAQAQNGPDLTISLTFDKRRSREVVHQMIADSYRQMYNGDPAYPTYPCLRNVSFCASEMTRPLQVADMLAWETYQVALGAVKTGKVELRPHILRLIETGRVTAALADKKTIKGLVDLFDPNSPHRTGSLHVQ